MFTEVCLGALGFHLAKQKSLILEDDVMVKKASKRSLNELEKVHEVLACLIRGVYMVDKERLRTKAEDLWKTVGYEPVDLKTLKLTGDDGDQFDKDLKRIVEVPIPAKGDVGAIARLVLFRRCEDRGDEHLIDAGVKPEVRVPPPKYVVAIRGTILRRNEGKSINLGDIKANVQIFLETLHAARDLYEPAMRLVKAICMQAGGGVNHVWIAGHSLGAMIAFIATRELALQNHAPLVLCPHLFNLPYSSLFGLVNSVFRDIIKTFDRGMKKAFSKSTFSLDGFWQQVAIPMFQEPLYRIAETVNPEYGESMSEESAKLKERDYFPYLYLNPNDLICRKYIVHFGVPEDPGQSTGELPAVEARAYSLSSSVLRCARVDAKTCNRVTHARVIINHWGKGPKQAHKLHQWFLYPTVDAEVYKTVKTSVEPHEGAVGESLDLQEDVIREPVDWQESSEV